MTHSTHLDYASCAPIRNNVRQAMITELTSGNDFYDPRRLYDDAIKIRYEIEESRAQVAAFFTCEPSEVVFTSSSTEALASFAYGASKLGKYIAVSPFESETILETLSSANIEVSNEPFKYSVASFLSYAHPDTGRIIDIENEIEKARSIADNCLVHLDARNASGYVDLNFKELDVDAMTVSSETWGGPVGVAALIIKNGVRVEALIKGASQERARRAGAENILAIKGFGELCKTEKSHLHSEIQHCLGLKQSIVADLHKSGCEVLDENKNTLPNMVSTKIAGVAASAVVAEFNRHGINIHAGSSCGSEEFEISKALLAIGLSETEAESVFRISWGYATTKEDVEAFSKALDKIVDTFQM